MQLVEDIRAKTGFSVNANTLRRFFGLVKTQYSASPSTLNILSKYCGFNSIDEISKLKPPGPIGNAPSPDSVLHYLVSLFKHMPLLEGHNATAESLVEQTIIFLDRHPGLIELFQREVAKTEAGRYYYFEMSVNMDKLHGYYGDGLFHYLQANPSDEGKLFAHSIQVLRYWLTGNKAMVDKHMSTIANIPVTNNCPSHILGRMIAARILYANMHREPVDKILGDATKYHVSLLAGSRNIPIPTFPDFELAVCEALVLTGQDEEGAEFIRRGKSLLGFSKQVNPVFPFRLWEYIIKSCKNPPRRSLPGSFVEPSILSPGVLNRKYQNLVQLALMKTTVREKKQLTVLIAETGYLSFEKIKNRHKKKK